jgi:universal stress protein A
MKIKPNKHSGEVVLEVGSRDERLLTAAATAPFRLKNILVPIDFSDCSRKALDYALPLAKQHGAGVTLLYVSPNPPYGGGEYGVIDVTLIEAEMRATGEKKLTAYAENEARGTVPLETIVRSSAPAVEIVQLAKSWPADLIVISTHGNTGLKHVLLGSVAEHVVRHAPCPVLVVREHEHEFLAS